MKLIREHIDEKFEEDRDPIHDMGLGITTSDIYECIQNFFKLDKNEKNIFSYWFLASEMHRYYFVVSVYYGTKISEENLIKYSKILLKKSYLINFLEMPNVSSLMWKIKSKYVDMFKGALNDIDESINEKFTEDSDPITDMGIGGYSFETLTPGALIKVRDDIHSMVALTQNQSGRFTDWRSGMKLRNNHFLLITRIINWDNVYKRIYFRRFYNEEAFNEYREFFKKTGQFKYGGNPNNMIVSKKIFNNKFRIIDRGF